MKARVLAPAAMVASFAAVAIAACGGARSADGTAVDAAAEDDHPIDAGVSSGYDAVGSSRRPGSFFHDAALFDRASPPSVGARTCDPSCALAGGWCAAGTCRLGEVAPGVDSATQALLAAA